MKPGAFIFAAALVLFSCKNEDKETTSTTDTLGNLTDTSLTRIDSPSMNDTMPIPMVNHASATLSATYPDTTLSGEARFDLDSATGQVKMRLNLAIPAKAGKSVAVHIHEHGDCGDKGNMAHGHWNPTNEAHGKWGSSAYHSGDIGNVKLDKSGNGSLTLTTDRWTLGGTADKNILRKALIVHGGADDFKTQPTGNAGSRIGCGIIQ